MVQEAFPTARLVVNATNRGFAAAVNQAIRRATGQYLLLLNSDTLAQPPMIDTLANFLRDHPRVGICGCRLRNARGQAQLYFGACPTLWTEAIRKWLWNPLARHPWGAAVLERWIRRPRQVDWVLGACLMIRRALIDRIGLLDERFFFYFEEVDWCRRATQAGWSVAYLPTVEAVHLGGRSVAHDPARLATEYRKSQRRFYRKHHGAWQQRMLEWYLAWQQV